MIILSNSPFWQRICRRCWSMDEELSTREASQKSGMSQGHLASLLRRHKLEGSYNSKQRRWMVSAAALERYLTVDDTTGERRFTYAKRLYKRAYQAVQEGHLAQ